MIVVITAFPVSPPPEKQILQFYLHIMAFDKELKFPALKGGACGARKEESTVLT
jgi:hypothetical protein